MILAYQLVFLHSVHPVVCGCAQTTYCELEGFCSVLRWAMLMCLLSLPDRERLQENLFLYHFHGYFYKCEKKDVFGRASVCCFV